MANAKTIEFILKAIGDFGDVKSNINIIQKNLNQLKLKPELKQSFDDIFSDLKKQTSKYQEYLNSGFKTKGDVTGLEKTGNRINALLTQLTTNMNKIDPTVLRESFTVDPTQFAQLNQELKNAQAALQRITSSADFSDTAKSVNDTVKELNKMSKSKAIEAFQNGFETGNIDKAREALAKLSENAAKFDDTLKDDNGLTKRNKYENFITQLSNSFQKLEKNEELKSINTEIDNLKTRLLGLNDKQLEELISTFEQGKTTVQAFTNGTQELTIGLRESAAESQSLGTEIDSFKNKAAYFFGLTNAVNLFQRTVRKAWETVVELDAVMTETAVVTDFTVGDMWEKLPEYASQARNLGASIKDVYAATTLYYQQGLKSNAAMSVGVETMKMARIAGMEASDATEAMTAALRGFNMEVNETNAVRVNDVYSELAAITAADTEQIATAMSKTASIAASANMEFETTAALLAQIIETTQEAPETAGTALKTIIARFAEVKKLASEGENTGEDEEGEEINVNKIQAALRTVNISMDEFFAGTEGLDSVLLRLAEKWGDLDFETQRYIATMAAGSRQQSRFIAMMSDYERTVQLATSANNSAGASQQQFDKTLDSMEAKVAKLTTAWQEFTMGLANNEILKAAVDTLTFVLDLVNKLIDGLSGNSGLSKSVITLNLAISAIVGIKRVIDKVLNSKLFGDITKAFKKIPQTAQQETDKAKENIVNTLSAGFKEVENEASESGARAGKNYSDSFNQNVDIEGAPKPAGQTGSQGDDKKPEADQTPTQSTPAPTPAPTPQSTSKKPEPTQQQKIGGVGIASNVVGAVLSIGGSMALAKDETSALGTALQNAGTAATMAGSAASLLAPALAAIGVTAGPLAAIIGVLTVAVAAFSAIAKDAYNKSLEGQMDAAQKATERAKEAADEAKASYDALLNDRDTYTQLQDSLKELSEGTQEWKVALAEANQQVLSLLDTYPQLAEFIKTGEYGQLIIDEAGFEKIQEIGLSQLLNTNRSISASQMVEMSIEKQLKENQLSEKYYKTQRVAGDSIDMHPEETYSELVDELFEKFQTDPEIFAEHSTMTWKDFVEKYEAAGNQTDLINIWNNNKNLVDKYGSLIGSFDYERISEDGTTKVGKAFKTSKDSEIMFTQELDDVIIQYSDRLYEVAEETGQLASNIYSMRTSFADYDLYLKTYASRLQVYSEQMISNLGEEAAGSEFATNVVAGMAKQQAEMAPEKINDKTTELLSENGIQKYANQLNSLGYNIVDTSGSDTTYQEIYKELTGQEATGMSKEAIAKEIAKIEIANENTQQAEDMILALEEAAKTDASGAKIAAALIGGNIDGLNIDEINSLRNMTSDDQVQLLGYDTEQDYAEAIDYQNKNINELDFYDQMAAAEAYKEEHKNEFDESTVQEVLSFMQENDVVVEADLQLKIDQDQIKQEAESRRDAIENTFKKTVWGKGFSESSLKSLSANTLENLSQQATEMGGMSAKNYLDAFNALFEQSGENKELANYLATVDWSNMTEATEAMEYLRSLGFDTTVIREFWSIAIKGAKTYISSTKEAIEFSTKMQEKIKSVNDISKALEEGTATNEQIQLLMESGVDVSEFQLTPEGWKATKEQIEEATRQLKEYNTELAVATAEQNNDILQQKKNTILYYNYASENEDGKLIANDIGDKIAATDIAQVIGESGQEEGETDSAFIARIQEALNKYLVEIEQAAILVDQTAGLAYTQNYSSDELEGMYPIQENIDEQTAINKIEQEATDAGFDVNEINTYADALQKTNEELSRIDAMQTALYSSKKSAGMKKIIDSYEDWNALIDENTGLIQVSSAEEAKTYNNLKESVGEMLNISTDLSDSFLDNAENIELIQKAINGDLEAFELLQKAAAKDYLGQIDAGEAKSKIDDFITYLEGTDLPVLETGVEWNGDGAADFIAQINGMAKAAQMTSTQVQEAIRAMGFEAEVTYKKIKTADGKNILVPQIKTLTSLGTSYNSYSPKASSGGGSTPEKWENPYDEFYNSVEKINEELRVREQLERRYQSLLDKTNTKASDLIDNANKQIQSLQLELQMRQSLFSGRQRQMTDIEREYSDLSKYASYDETNQVIKIDWAAIEKLDGSTNEKLTSRIEEYIGKLEEQQKLIEDEYDSILEIEDQVKEIKDRGKEEYLNLEDQIKLAIEKTRQDEIDQLSAINDSINDTNSRLIDAMQSSIDSYRQNRENEKTEQELSDKQRRLAYLQQDTSGANAMEILRLQKEIEEGQESYTDTLIDQKISELQQQNDQAAEQRQQQIELMQQQLDHYIKSGKVWADVYALMDEGLDEKNGLIRGSTLETLLQSEAGFDGMSIIQKMEWMEKTNDMIAQALGYLKLGRQLEDIGAKKGSSIKFTTPDGRELTGTVNKDGSVTASNGKTYNNVYQGYDGKYYTDETPETEKPKTESSPQKTTTKNNPYGVASNQGNYYYAKNKTAIQGGNAVKAIQWALQDMGKNPGPIDGIYGNSTWKAVKDFQKEEGITADGDYGPVTKERMKLRGYKTGGLADFTGPAWLDGTKSRPEYILNADQTKAFFSLVDVLEGLSMGTSQNSQNTGDNIYDIDINVESIGNDYDVEQIASTIKRMINEDARYRNNNAINLSR